MNYGIGHLTLLLSTCAACTGTLDPQSTSEPNSTTTSNQSSSASSAAGGATTGIGGTANRSSSTNFSGGVSSVAATASTAANVTSGGNTIREPSSVVRGGASTASFAQGGNAPTASSARGGNAPAASSAQGGNAPAASSARGGNASSATLTRGGNTSSQTSAIHRGGGVSAVGGTTATGGTSHASSTQTGGTSTSQPTTSAPRLPEANAPFDYQIGGDYTPPAGVKIVSRDRKSQPAAGLYNICYVNGFQSQPDEESFWKQQHPELLLRNGSGAFVVDEDWGEYLLDTSTAEKRQALGAIVGDWIKQCAKAGFDAVEIDNLDSYSRSSGLLNQSQNVSMMRIFSDVAHANGLAVAQKNSTELLGNVSAMGTDFAVAEECNRWDECGDYQQAYGNRVYIIEYRASDFKAGCTAYPELSIVLRDLNVSTPSSGSYVFEGC